MITLSDILEIENSEEILSFKCPQTGYLLWPLIRNHFMRYIIYDTVYDGQVWLERPAPKPPRAYQTILKACIHNIKRARGLRAPILISSTGSHIMVDGKYFNRLSDPFAMLLPEKTITMEALSPFDWHWPFPRHNEKTFFDSHILAAARLFGKIAVNDKHYKVSDGLVQFVGTRAFKILGWRLSEERRAFLTLNLAQTTASIPLQRSLYSSLFRQHGTRLLIREEGCYGGSSILLSTAHDNGIITAEYQHGSVSPGHDAYNVAKHLQDSREYRNTLPKYFLGYGIWWIDQINVPVIKLAVGNPQETRNDNTEESLDIKKDILVLGDGLETEKYIILCQALATKLKTDHRIVFRPHPMEICRIKQLGMEYNYKFDIDLDKPIRSALKGADIVISEVSTGLFEAVGRANRIFLWETPKAKFCYPSHPFTAFSHVDELIDKVNDGKSGTLDATIRDRLWAPDWDKNYLAFLAKVCPQVF